MQRRRSYRKKRRRSLRRKRRRIWGRRRRRSPSWVVPRRCRCRLTQKMQVSVDTEAHLKVQKKQVPNELERYMAEELFPPRKDFDILGWWEVHGAKYPVLSCIARDVLAIQASTVASESSFSAGGRIITDHRSRLKSEMVEALICLQDWLKAADPKPISKDLEEEECLVFYQVSECHEETAAHQGKVAQCNELDGATRGSTTGSAATQAGDPSY